VVRAFFGKNMQCAGKDFEACFLPPDSADSSSVVDGGFTGVGHGRGVGSAAGMTCDLRESPYQISHFVRLTILASMPQSLKGF
ncbi:MAG: hypothetical protein VW440_07375, partial [Bordetella sp.]